MSPYDQTQYDNIGYFLTVCTIAAILFPLPKFWMRLLIVIMLSVVGYKSEMKKNELEQQPQNTRDWYRQQQEMQHKR